MTREAFIRKWLANKDFQYCEDGRAQMREDLDKVIDYAQQKLNIASVSGSANGAVDTVAEALDFRHCYIRKNIGCACTNECGYDAVNERKSSEGQP